MNPKIIQKCIDELKKEGEFRKDYVLGLLEALIETNPVTTGFTTSTPSYEKTTIVRTESVSDEETGDIPDFLKPGPKGNIG